MFDFQREGSFPSSSFQVFKEIFYKLDHGAHYRMMMHEDETAEVAVEEVAVAA